MVIIENPTIYLEFLNDVTSTESACRLYKHFTPVYNASFEEVKTRPNHTPKQANAMYCTSVFFCSIGTVCFRAYYSLEDASHQSLDEYLAKLGAINCVITFNSQNVTIS